MIKISENTNPSKNNSKKLKLFWVKLSIAITLLLITSWLILFLFSNFIFSTSIKRAYSELSGRQYSLDFENLKINLFTREITFYETYINRSKEADSLDRPKISFYSDTLVLGRINFLSLLKNRSLSLKHINIKQFKLNAEIQSGNLNRSKLMLPLSSYLKALNILNIKVAQAEINYKLGNDSIFIPAFNFQLYEFRIDSLTDSVKTNRFHFSDIDLVLKNQQLNVHDKGHSLTWESLKLSTKEKKFELDNFKIRPLPSANESQTFTADIPKFRLQGFEFDSLISKKQLLTKYLVLHINHFAIQFNDSFEKSDSSNIRLRLNAFFEDNFNKIAIDSSRIFIDNSQINLSNNQQLNISGENNLFVSQFRFNPENSSTFSLADGSLSLNNFVFYNFQNKQKIAFKQGQINYDKKTLSLFGIDFVSDSGAKINLQLEEIRLEKMDWNQLLDADKLVAGKLLLKGGDFIQKRFPKSQRANNQLSRVESFLFPFINSIKIKSIQFEDWDYLLRSKAINAKSIFVNLNLFQLPRDQNLAFGAFSDFDIKINKFSLLSTNRRHRFLANTIESNSKTQNITIARIESIPIWKTPNQKLPEAANRFKVNGQNINIQTQKPFHLLQLKDTLVLSILSIDSLSLIQFGKNINEEKQKSGIPPIHISSFELRKGEYTAYNDSSTFSRLIQINGIQLKGDSLEILSDSLISVNYRHFLAITSNGAYQNNAQGLGFNFQTINFDSEDDAMSLHQLKAEFSSEKKGKSTHHQFDTKLVQIKGFDHNLFLQHNWISAREVKFNSPSFISKSQSDTKQPITNFRNFFSAEKIEQLPYMEFDRFIINDLTWLATYTVNNNTNITTFEKADFEAVDFRLSYRSFTNPERTLFSKSFDFHIDNLEQHLSNGNYLLMIDDIGFSSLQKQMNFEKIQFYTFQKEEQNNYNFSIDRISLNEINFADFQRDYSLSVENISVENPVTSMRFYRFDNNSTINNLNTLELYPALKPYFSQITLKSINVRDMNLELEVPKSNSTNFYNLDHLDLQMQNLKIDSTTKAFQYNRFFYTKNILVHLRNYSARIANDLYNVNFKNLRLSTHSGHIEVDSLSLKPQYNYADFAQRVQHQTDRYDIDVNNIKLSGIDFQDAIFRQKYTAKHAEINELKGEAYRDGLYPRLPNFFPPNPIQRLLDLPYFIQIDSLYVNDAFFAYKEKGEHTEVPGYIYFDKLNAQIFNTTNNPDFIKFGGQTVLNAQALLMGKSQLNLEANFPLINHGKSFHLNALLNRIEMDDLDPILRPLALIQARSGIIKSVDLSVEANDDYAFGEMIMLYDNMKVEVLNKWMKKGILGTFFANALIKTENPSYLIPRKGPIYFERNKTRSIFNYWAEISILGMKTSMGLADRRTAKKVKRLKKGKL